MLRYLGRRLLVSLPVLLGVVFIVFAIARLLPGDPCRAVLGERATDLLCDEFTRVHGLDQPIPAQFVAYVSQLASGDLGVSLKFGRPVSELLIERLPVTMELGLYSLLLAVVAGGILGTVSAAKRNSKVDAATMLVANLGVSIPVFVLGLLLAYLFAIVLRDTPLSLPPSGRLSPGISVRPLVEVWGLEGLPDALRSALDFVSGFYTFTALITGQWEAFVDAVRHLVLPALALGTIPMALIARMTRSSLVEVLGQDYIRTARAKGMGEILLVFRHGLRNAMLPVVTVVGLSLGGILSGAVLTETIFNLAGVGRTITEAVLGRDYVVIQAVTLVTAVGYLAVNLVVDVSYALLDPRVRLR